MNISRPQDLLKGQGAWIVILALLASGIASGFALARLVAPPPPPVVEEPAPLPEQVQVAALGRIEPQGEVIEVGGPTTERIARLEVDEGDYVRQGEVIAYLDSYEERLAERDYAASQLTEAEARLKAETQLGQAQIQEAQTRLQQVDRPQLLEIEAQQASIRELEAELTLARVDLQRLQSLQREGAISQQEYDQQLWETRQVEERLNNAKVNLARLESARSTDLSNAQAQVESQRANMARSQAQIEVDSAARNLQLAEAKLDRTIILTPRDGEVLRIITHPSEVVSENGIVELGNTRQMFVVAEVYESDVGKVRVGQQATVTSRNGAFDQTLTGVVERIGSQIFKNNVLDDDPAANADARVVEVEIRLNNSQSVAKLTNLQVDVSIDVE